MNDKMLKIPEVAKRFSVCVSTVRKWMADGELKCVSIGDVVRVRESALNEFITANERTREEVSA